MTIRGAGIYGGNTEALGPLPDLSGLDDVRHVPLPARYVPAPDPDDGCQCESDCDCDPEGSPS